eukprot:12412861-Karenia_brevis.AAC.1
MSAASSSMLNCEGSRTADEVVAEVPPSNGHEFERPPPSHVASDVGAEERGNGTTRTGMRGTHWRLVDVDPALMTREELHTAYATLFPDFVETSVSYLDGSESDEDVPDLVSSTDTE